MIGDTSRVWISCLVETSCNSIHATQLPTRSNSSAQVSAIEFQSAEELLDIVGIRTLRQMVARKQPSTNSQEAWHWARRGGNLRRDIAPGVLLEPVRK